MMQLFILSSHLMSLDGGIIQNGNIFLSACYSTHQSAVFSHHHHHDGMAQSHLWTELMIDNTDTFLISWAFTVLSITHFQITLFSRMFVVLLCCTFPITSLSHLIAGSLKASLKISKTDTSRSWCFSQYFYFIESQIPLIKCVCILC